MSVPYLVLKHFHFKRQFLEYIAIANIIVTLKLLVFVTLTNLRE